MKVVNRGTEDSIISALKKASSFLRVDNAALCVVVFAYV